MADPKKKAELSKKKKLVGTGRHLSAMKRHRQSLKRNARNKSVGSATKTEIKKARAAITSKNKETATTSLKTTISALSRAATKGVIPKKRASRLSSRLAKSVNALS
jgi:small subunit ribosomal protein S20